MAVLQTTVKLVYCTLERLVLYQVKLIFGDLNIKIRVWNQVYEFLISKS
tara:strand:+ start:376 stop:522 length:147 start_codon:yes stop_codon:yes gene_type:complete